MMIKEASEKDIVLIQQLARKSWEKAYRGIISDEQIEYMLGTMYSAQELHHHFTENPHYHYFIIYENETPLGFVGYEHHYEPQTTKLHRIYLIPEAQGKGLGKAGIEHVKKSAALHGDHTVILNVNKANHAQKVYESQGFTVRDSLVLDIGSGFVMDDYVMEFQLKSFI